MPPVCLCSHRRREAIDLILKAWKIQQFNTFLRAQTHTRHKVHNIQMILILSKTTSGVQCQAEWPGIVWPETEYYPHYWRYSLQVLLLPVVGPIQNARKSILRLNHIKRNNIKTSHNRHNSQMFSCISHFKNAHWTITNVTRTKTKFL